MADQFRRPTGDGDASGTFTTYPTTGAKYLYVDEEVANDSDYFYEVNTEDCYALFVSPSFDVPNDATVEHVSVWLRVSGYPGMQYYHRIKVNGSYYNGDLKWIGGLFSLQSHYFTVNPNTGVAWLPADVNGGGSNPLQQFGIYILGSTYTANVSQVFLAATYTLPENTGSSIIWL